MVIKFSIFKHTHLFIYLYFEEINFLWAIHQAHHSSEDFNLIAGLRQAALQPFTAWASDKFHFKTYLLFIKYLGIFHSFGFIWNSTSNLFSSLSIG